MLRIEAISVTGGQSFVIASGTGRRGDGAKEVADNIDVTFDAIVPRAAYINGAGQAWIPNATANYNETGDLPLTIDYQFANSAAGVSACFAFWSDLQTKVPVLANIILSVGPGGAVRNIPNVKLRPLRVRTEGEVAVKVTYPISFGKILRVLQAV